MARQRQPIFGVTVEIEPPRTSMVADLSNAEHSPLMTDKPVVVARFEIEIGNLFKTTFMQIIDVHTAHDEAYFLLMKAGMFDQSGDDAAAVLPAGQASSPVLQELPNLAGVLAVSSEVVFALGKLQWLMGDVARLHTGSEIEIPFPGGDVELIVNG